MSSVLLVCTWGEQGAIAVFYDKITRTAEWARCSAWFPPDDAYYVRKARVMDTVGAGDTFIAGMLFSLAYYPRFSLQQKLRYAVEIASRKVYQDGFKGLGKAMQMRGPSLDPTKLPWTESSLGLGSKDGSTPEGIVESIESSDC